MHILQPNKNSLLRVPPAKSLCDHAELVEAMKIKTKRENL